MQRFHIFTVIFWFRCATLYRRSLSYHRLSYVDLFVYYILVLFSLIWKPRLSPFPELFQSVASNGEQNHHFGLCARLSLCFLSSPRRGFEVDVFQSLKRMLFWRPFRDTEGTTDGIVRAGMRPAGGDLRAWALTAWRLYAVSSCASGARKVLMARLRAERGGSDPRCLGKLLVLFNVFLRCCISEFEIKTEIKRYVVWPNAAPYSLYLVLCSYYILNSFPFQC